LSRSATRRTSDDGRATAAGLAALADDRADDLAADDLAADDLAADDLAADLGDVAAMGTLCADGAV
jgi:hypothetical protein